MAVSFRDPNEDRVKLRLYFMWCLAVTRREQMNSHSSFLFLSDQRISSEQLVNTHSNAGNPDRRSVYEPDSKDVRGHERASKKEKERLFILI